jgi:putative hemolysin
MNSPTHHLHARAQSQAGSQSLYRARLAQTAADVRAAQALRFQVFNLELDEGLAQSYDSGLDADRFDAVCVHLIVEDALSGAVVGTYRMQTGVQASQGLGYYSEREFDFAPFEARRSQMLELGRACIHQHHRNFAVLNLLWTGILAYARAHGARYLLGCSSLTSQAPSVGAAAYLQLGRHAAPSAWQTLPHRGFACDLAMPAREAVQIPRLMSAYLGLGAAICGPPAIDREFGTIDFLTWIDVKAPRLMALQRRGRFTA